MWSWSHAKVCPASFEKKPKASKKQPLCAKIFKKISEDTPTSTSVLQVSCKMFSPTWIVEVSSMTKYVEHVITVQPSLHAMLFHSFELNHQPKYFSSHKNGKRNQQNSPSHTILVYFLPGIFPFPSKLTIPLKNHLSGNRW